jgi:hypothetical protein
MALLAIFIIMPLIGSAAADPPTGIYQGTYTGAQVPIIFKFNFHDGIVDCFQDGPYHNENLKEPYTVEANGVNFTRGPAGPTHPDPQGPVSMPKFQTLLGSIFMTAADRFHFSHDPEADIAYLMADTYHGDDGMIVALSKPTPFPPAPSPVLQPTGTYQGDYNAGLYTLTFSFNFHDKIVDAVQDGPYRNEYDKQKYTIEANHVNFTRDSMKNLTSALGSIFMTAADRFHYSHDPKTDVAYIIADDRPGDSGALIPLTKSKPPPPAPSPIPEPTGAYVGKFQSFTFTFTFFSKGKVDCDQDGPYHNENKNEPYTIEPNGVNFTRGPAGPTHPDTQLPVSLPKFQSLLGSVFMTAADRFHFSHDPVTDVAYIIADDYHGDTGCKILLMKKTHNNGLIVPSSCPDSSLSTKWTMENPTMTSQSVIV